MDLRSHCWRLELTCPAKTLRLRKALQRHSPCRHKDERSRCAPLSRPTASDTVEIQASAMCAIPFACRHPQLQFTCARRWPDTRVVAVTPIRCSAPELSAFWGAADAASALLSLPVLTH